MNKTDRKTTTDSFEESQFCYCFHFKAATNFHDLKRSTFEYRSELELNKMEETQIANNDQAPEAEMVMK
jgi:hypothetical protein